jgi:hypothetical protein
MSRYTEYYQSNLDKCKRKVRRWECLNPGLARTYRKKAIWKHQGIDFTWEQYLSLLRKQDYKCAICGKHRSEQKWDFAVDHNHVTKKIRGLLCMKCNSILINAVENHPELVTKAFNYLEESK